MSFKCPWCQGELPGRPGQAIKCRHCLEEIYWGDSRPFRTQFEARSATNELAATQFPVSSHDSMSQQSEQRKQEAIDEKINKLLEEQKAFAEDRGRLPFYDRFLLLLVKCFCRNLSSEATIDRFLQVRRKIYFVFWQRLKRIPGLLLWFFFAIAAAFVVFFAGVFTPKVVQPHVVTAVNKITVLTEALAKDLVTQFKGDELDLSGLVSIDEAVAAELANWGGKCLKLNGLESIGASAAAELAEWQGNTLELSGIQQLPQVVAQALAQWQGDLLRLAGVKSLPEDSARELAKAKAESLDLIGLVEIGEKTFAILKANPSIALPRTQLAAQQPVANASLQSVTNSIGIKLNKIPAGTFTMGEGNKAHEVTLTKPFFIGVTEVTNAQWKAVIEEVPSQWKDNERPVERVSWNDVVRYCARLSAFPAERAAGRVYRLPTEAEWEYACRAGSATVFSFGDDESLLGNYAWFNVNARGQTHPVGKKRANSWGLYDMNGNVFEWCSDWLANYSSSAVVNPNGSQTGIFRVYRGGTWSQLVRRCRSADRGGDLPTTQSSSLGFRLAMSVSDNKSTESGR